MIPESAVWAILFLPLGSFLVIVVRPLIVGSNPAISRFSGYVTIFSLALAFILSVWAWQSTLGSNGLIGWDSHTWLTVGALDIGMGIMLNPLTAIMLVVVNGVSLIVQIYSLGYMRDDPSFSRYFAFMSLFTASMLGLVLARNMIQLFVFWELVGVCSYLLIGFWHHKPAAAAAAKKAFIITRIGDFGLLLAIMYLFLHRGAFFEQGLNPFDIEHIGLMAKGGEVAGLSIVPLAEGTLMWLGLGIFAGAAGKSAQFPLHTWLPDAMEGPTPVSALIHAATMVAAGVFLVARFFPVFEASSIAMNTVALIGAFTALMAASMGLVMNDIKRVLAYSTISQLGFMMLALGVGAPGVAIFHLFNHAFFKALLFLGSGSVNHATGTFDMRYMGGLRHTMPLTYLTFLIASLSIAGLFPFSGFWSKDEIFVEAMARGGVVGPIVLAMGIAAAFMTAFYMFRVLFMTFHGNFRGGVLAEDEAAGRVASQTTQRRIHLGESPLVMVLPLIVLAIPTVFSGFLANPLNDIWGLGLVPAHWIAKFLGTEAAHFNIGLAAATSLLTAIAIALAFMIYQKGRPRAENVSSMMGPVTRIVSDKYYMDRVFEDVIVRGIFYRRACLLVDWIDRAIVDGVVDFLGWWGRNIGRGMGRFQTGQVQSYGIAISLGILGILLGYLVWA